MELTISHFIEQAPPVPVQLTINCTTEALKKIRKCMNDYCKLNHIKIKETVGLKESTVETFAIYVTYNMEGDDYTIIIREDIDCQTDLGLFVKYLGEQKVINSAKAKKISRKMGKMRVTSLKYESISRFV